MKLNLDLKEKNTKMLELLDELEEVRVQVFARDKSIELQKEQISSLLEELREQRLGNSEYKQLL